ncbi:MAG: sigma-70 family RNA polymerase sigma factor [bacterium]
MSTPRDITQLLSAARGGNPGALDQVFALVYDEVHRLAHAQIARAGRSPTLNTTAVVHEAYIKLAHTPLESLEDRRHFFAIAATAMRQVLVDYARRRNAAKRGGGAAHLSLDVAEVPVASSAAEIVELEWALQRLTAVDERLARVVELRFFGGLSEHETAEVMDVSDRTVQRDWRAARAFLSRELAGDGGESRGLETERDAGAARDAPDIRDTNARHSPRPARDIDPDATR